jgi:hypothetical protein
MPSKKRSVDVTADEAFEKTGGFGKFQKFQILMNTIGNGADGFFFYAFSFLEKEPIFKCKDENNEWYSGTRDNNLKEEYCSVDHECEVDWTHPQSIHNILAQIDYYCAPGW